MSKCPQCKHNYTSKTHKTRCLRQTWKPKPRASRARARGSWSSFNSSAVAGYITPINNSFYSDLAEREKEAQP